jgi:tetratricopeptide (TPR) repeat protein
VDIIRQAEVANSTGATDSMEKRRPTPIVRDAHALLVRGIDALERDNIDEAIGLLRQSVEFDPESFFGNLALGIALTKAFEIPAAESALEAAIDLDPKSFWAHLRMAELHHRVGVPSKAKVELRTALNLATSATEKKVARDLLEAEKLREPRRAWRPDFIGLLRRKGPPR